MRQALVTMVRSPSYADDEPEPSYRPSARLARTVRLRDVTSDFPCSSTSAQRSDLDHTEPWPRGQAALPNLGARSRRVHRAEQAGWTPRPLPDGSLLWQSPSGAGYRRPPPRPPASAEDLPPRWSQAPPGHTGASGMPEARPAGSVLPDEPPF